MKPMFEDFPHKVRRNSVPACLRHGSPRDAMEQAKNLTTFLSYSLQSFVNEMADGVPDDLPEITSGMMSVFDLLRDKIAIAQGALPWPGVSLFEPEGLPPLWQNPDRQGDL